MFRFDASCIDKSLPVPVGTQLHGLLSYALAFGGIANGSKLQSVRRLAAELGIAPMTVQQVYQRLRDAGLIEMRPGIGAYSARDPHNPASAKSLPMGALRGDIEALLAKAAKLDLSTMSLVSMINAQASFRPPRVGLTIVFVAIFEGPGRDYVAEIKAVLGRTDLIQLQTLDALKISEPARASTRAADVVLTFVNREPEVRALVPEARILGLRFIPAERTRRALAGLDPRLRVAAITHFQEYIAIMRPSVREFAPHINDIRVTWSSAPELPEVIAQCDAVIYASGAEHVADLVAPGKPCFEYRHAPDLAMLETVLVPYLDTLREVRIGGGPAAADPHCDQISDCAMAQ